MNQKQFLMACVLLSVSVFFLRPAFAQQAASKEESMPFYVYQDKGSAENHFSPSGWMGDYSDIQYSEDSQDNPHGGSTCIKIVYLAKGFSGAGWAGIYWQNPPNNWGKTFGGFNLSQAKRLVFYARGEHGGEVIAEVKVGGIKGDYPDSGTAAIKGPVALTNQWQEYSIDLSGVNLSSVSGGFCWSARKQDSGGSPIIFYLDDIRFE